MKIIDKRIGDIPFKELKPTSIFKIENRKFMKIKDTGELIEPKTSGYKLINSINIENGKLNYFSENTLVTPLKAEINLYEY